jgi:hypothetical protein
MANFVFGDILNVVVTHLGTTYRYSPKANESGTLDKGGYRTNDDKSQITSNGQMMRQINRERWEFECPIAVDTISDAEMTGLNIMSASPVLGSWQFELISGSIFIGQGCPVGAISTDTNAGTLTLKCAGNGELQKI